MSIKTRSKERNNTLEDVDGYKIVYTKHNDREMKIYVLDKSKKKVS